MDLCNWLWPGSTLDSNKLAPELIWLRQHNVFLGEPKEDAEGCTCFCGVGMCIVVLCVKPDLTHLHVWQNEGEVGGCQVMFVYLFIFYFFCFQPALASCAVAGLHDGRFLEATWLTRKTHKSVCCLGPDHTALTVNSPSYCSFCSTTLFYICTDEPLPSGK